MTQPLLLYKQAWPNSMGTVLWASCLGFDPLNVLPCEQGENGEGSKQIHIAFEFDFAHNLLYCLDPILISIMFLDRFYVLGMLSRCQ